MAVPSSGELKLSDLAAEFSDSAPHQMSEFYRGGAKVPNAPANAGIPTSGQIGIGQFYGAQNRIPLPLSITSSTQNYDVYTQASASPLYSAGATDITLTISPGINVGSTSTGTYALAVPGSFTTGDTITIVNNGTVIGRGGEGGRGGAGNGSYTKSGAPGGAGGNAVYVNYPTTITNNGTLAGAGGGGGGGYAFGGANQLAGGGGGGGAGYSGGSGGAGGPGTLGGGSGGTGTLTSGGSGGRGGGGGAFPGGAGGGQGSAGAGGSGGPYGPPGAGGGAGNYIVGSPLVTWPATGTRLGGSS